MVSDYNNFLGTECRLEATKHAAAVLDPLNNAVEILKMFPNKVVNAQVFSNVFFSTIRKGISLCWAVNQDIVNVRNYSV
jgi:hypothetical protein